MRPTLHFQLPRDCARPATRHAWTWGTHCGCRTRGRPGASVEAAAQATGLVGVLGVQLQLGAGRGQLQSPPSSPHPAPLAPPQPWGPQWGGGTLTRALVLSVPHEGQHQPGCCLDVGAAPLHQEPRGCRAASDQVLGAPTRPAPSPPASDPRRFFGAGPLRAPAALTATPLMRDRAAETSSTSP